MTRSDSAVLTLHEPPPPPVSVLHLINSNTPPHPAEASVISSYVGELESHLASVQDAIQTLLARSDDLRRRHKRYKAILSPIRRLPPEILGLIFSEAVHASVSNTYAFGNVPSSEAALSVTRHAPWLLTHVCHHWAAVALATPALWSMLRLDLDFIGNDKPGVTLLVDRHLQRAQNAPLTMKLTQENELDNESHPVFDVALPSAAQWRIADLYLQPQLLQQLTRVESGFRSLSTLLISIDLAPWPGEEDTSTFRETLRDLFIVTPELKCVRALAWDLTGFICPPYTLPWHQLTRLSTTTASNVEALALLRQLSSIVECNIAFSHDHVLSPNHGDCVHLPHLQTLALQIEDDDEVVIYKKHTSILDFIETPRLTRLALYSTADEEAVLGLVTRSNCARSLTSLELHSDSIDPDRALLLMERLSRLTSLGLGDLTGQLISPRGVSLEDIVRGLSEQWMKIRDSTQILNVLLTDRVLSRRDARNLTSRLASLDADWDGIFSFKVSSSPVYPDIIMHPILTEDSHFA
ncbi:hypothetical protein R3P38DRAFT_2651632 [Favolaschia claudopus]|uniref:F-box domain-containing protein n=1 Tax=Favolaschia claudopus TaxID=2862362 RepID=A0AAW0A2D1_9AGAR